MYDHLLVLSYKLFSGADAVFNGYLLLLWHCSIYKNAVEDSVLHSYDHIRRDGYALCIHGELKVSYTGVSSIFPATVGRVGLTDIISVDKDRILMSHMRLIYR